MIIWRGRGFLVVVIVFMTLLLMQLGLDGLNGDGYYLSHAWPKVLAGLIAATPIWLLGKKWNDESDGAHTLFFVPMQYWAFVVLAATLWLAISPSETVASAPAVAETPAQNQPAPEPTTTTTTAPAPIQASAITVPAPAPPPPVVRNEPAKVEPPAPVAEAQPKFVQVYVDREMRYYYPEDCAGRPENTYRVARSIARQQGFTRAPTCKE